MSELSTQRLKEALSYDPETGLFAWRGPTRPGLSGRSAGTVRNTGYVVIGLDGRYYLAHRLAWFYAHGAWPSLDLDHINGDAQDNRLVNLRLATKSQNRCNTARHRRNKAGLKGVYWHARDRRYIAQISVNGQRRYLGAFETAEEAHAAYASAALSHYGEFARTS